MKKTFLFVLLFQLTFCQTNSRSSKEESVDQTSNDKSKTENISDDMLVLKENESLIATIKTNLGVMKLELYPDKAPKTVKNFVGLIQQKYYDGIIFHRIIPNFMIQGGDPTGTGSGGRAFMERVLRMNSILLLNIASPGYYQWQTLARIRTEASFSLLLFLLPGWTDAIRFLGK